MPMEVYDHAEHPYSRAAELWLCRALSDVISGGDALIAISAAEACLLIEAGEREPDPALISEAPKLL